MTGKDLRLENMLPSDSFLLGMQHDAIQTQSLAPTMTGKDGAETVRPLTT